MDRDCHTDDRYIRLEFARLMNLLYSLFNKTKRTSEHLFRKNTDYKRAIGNHQSHFVLSIRENKIEIRIFFLLKKIIHLGIARFSMSIYQENLDLKLLYRIPPDWCHLKVKYSNVFEWLSTIVSGWQVTASHLLVFINKIFYFLKWILGFLLYYYYSQIHTDFGF